MEGLMVSLSFSLSRALALALALSLALFYFRVLFNYVPCVPLICLYLSLSV